MYNGSNDYNVFRLNPSEVVVSRTLQSRYRNFSNVVWRSGKPALDSEWNLINDITSETLLSYIQSKTPSGWLTLGKNAYIDYYNRPDTFVFNTQENNIECVTPNCLVNGWPLLVAGVRDNNTNFNFIKLNPAGEVARWDFIFLEVWRAQVRSRDTNNIPICQNKPDLNHIYKFGNVQFGLDSLEKISQTKFKTRFFPLESNSYEVFKNGVKLIKDLQFTIDEEIGEITFLTIPQNSDKFELRLIDVNLIDDIVDKAIKPSVEGIETSQRIQIQYRVRVVEDIDFLNTDSEGFNDSKVQGQGGNFNPQMSGYSFENMKLELDDCGLWRAGKGDEASKVALKSVDGFSYAIPMFKIFRRNTNVYNDNSNQLGNIAKLIDETSDRPDGKFNDGISASDILDMRNKVFISTINYEKIMEENLDKLFKGELRTNRLQQIAYDSISITDIIGYNDFSNNIGTNGKRMFWSDSSIQQNNIFAEVTTTTTNNSLEVFRASGTGDWAIGDIIKIKLNLNLPTNTIINSVRMYLENKLRSDLTSKGNWSGLHTNEATFVFTNVDDLNDYDIWIYYDIILPEGQGISYVPDDILRINYSNYLNYINGNVVRGTRLEPEVTRFQDLFDHPYENKNNDETFVETSSFAQRKQLKISPLIQTTTVRNGDVRTLEVETLDVIEKTIFVPYPLQHLRGVYTSATEGTELAMNSVIDQPVSSLDFVENKIILSSDVNGDYFVGSLSSIKYDRNGTGLFEELLILNGGQYGPVFQHKTVLNDLIGTRVSLYTSSGEPFILSVSDTPERFKWSGKKIRVRQGNSGYGYELNGYLIDCKESDNTGLIDTMQDRQKVWVDCDYLGAPHKGAEIRIIYKYTPYQGSDIGGQNFSLEYKRHKGIFFNNGTGGGNISISDNLGTSNFSYTPLSPKLPGNINDYLRDGQVIQLSSDGTKRFESDFWSNAVYDVYGFGGGGVIWNNNIQLPSTPETINKRGFLGNSAIEVIFEEPSIDQTNAEFILPLLVKNKITGKLFLLLQIGNKGIHKLKADEKVFLDIFNLNERILLK